MHLASIVDLVMEDSWNSKVLCDHYLMITDGEVMGALIFKVVKGEQVMRVSVG